MIFNKVKLYKFHKTRDYYVLEIHLHDIEARAYDGYKVSAYDLITIIESMEEKFWENHTPGLFTSSSQSTATLIAEYDTPNEFLSKFRKDHPEWFI